MSLAERPHALWLLAAVSFIECSLFPVPPDILLMPLVLRQRQRWFRIALVCSVASLFGSYFGYFIGAFLFDQVAEPMLRFYGYLDKFKHISDIYNRWGDWIVFLTSFTPFPYKVITIFSGASGLNPLTFGIAGFISRSIRFFGEAALLWHFGAPIQVFIERHLHTLAVGFVVFVASGFIALHYL